MFIIFGLFISLINWLRYNCSRKTRKNPGNVSFTYSSEFATLKVSDVGPHL